ncbi:flagellar hook-length control protein FliK [Paracidovorax anthurii]|uniref:Flagellar hook-length control protein FliK n=1 Tax=Paracidovorax anthurii TaxID=78229 RepID=A0A328ZCJ4_9BURK|nr:flagellar hook-length control protein FliK [Paracidovorax anthurii]RAR80016.1 flagellar hook-length control protein FliK [Paracidovorax anthurii]
MNTDTHHRISRGASSAQSGHETRGARGAGKAAGTNAAPGSESVDASQGGFSMLLASLGDTGLSGDAGLPGGNGLLSQDGSVAVDAATDPAAALTGTQSGPSDPLAALQGVLPAAITAGWASPALSGAAGAQPLRASGLMDASSLVSQTSLIDGAADLSGASTAGMGRGQATARMGAGRAPHAAANAPAGLAGGDTGGVGGSDALGLARKGEVRTGAAEGLAAAGMAASQTGAERRDGMAMPVGAPMAGRSGEPSPSSQGIVEMAATALQGAGRGDAGTASGGAVDRAAVPPVGANENGQALSSGGGGVSAEGSATMADPSQIPMEDQIAEQVAYWVHQKTQNAELTIDRDGQPVEVTVSLSGNEAHVAFRSDQSHTRDMLDTSVAQLRELLRGEGLELAGVTVGQSGGGSAGDDAGRSSSRGDGARVARVQAGVPQAAGAVARPSAPSDRALDIFV